MITALDVQLKIGTGDLLGEDIPPINKLGSIIGWEDSANRIIDIIDSEQGITGKKLVYLRSFQPGATYEFNYQVDSSFADFDTTKDVPLVVHLIDTNAVQTAKDLCKAVWQRLRGGGLENFVREMIGYVKESGFVKKKLSSTGGTFKITPGNFQPFLLFTAYTSAGPNTCVITEFDKATNTFTLGGV